MAMTITEKKSSTSINKELGEELEKEKSLSPWSELLMNSAVPAAAVAVKLCEDSPDEVEKDTTNKEKPGVLSSFQRRTFSRLSFRGENGPLLGLTNK